jgi:hypothetical protein
MVFALNRIIPFFQYLSEGAVERLRQLSRLCELLSMNISITFEEAWHAIAINEYHQTLSIQ